MNSERAITDVAALLHAVKVYLIGRAVSGVMGLFERIAQADHAKHAAARHNDVALSVVGCTGVEDHCIIRFFGKAGDYGAFFRAASTTPRAERVSYSMPPLVMSPAAAAASV